MLAPFLFSYGLHDSNRTVLYIWAFLQVAQPTNGPRRRLQPFYLNVGFPDSTNQLF